jgi:hypothetical protein
MKKLMILLALVSILPATLSADVFAKVGTAGMQFLKLGVDARAEGMAEAFTAVSNDVSSIYYNPGGLALAEENQVFFMHKLYVADIQQEYLAASFLSDYGTFGVHFNFLHMDDMDVIKEELFAANGETFTCIDFSSGLTYSNAFTDKFSFGFTLKYLQETLGEYNSYGFSFDLGSQYNVGWQNLTIGMALRDYGPNMKFEIDNDDDGQTDEDPFDLIDNDGDGLVDEDREELDHKIPMTFSLGVAIDAFRDDLQYLVLSGQVDNVVDRKETFNVGAEYKYSVFVARAGYHINGEEIASGASFGFGFLIPTSFSTISVDFSHTEMGDLQEDFMNADNRFSIKLTF